MEPDASKKATSSYSAPNQPQQVLESAEAVAAHYGPGVYDLCLYDPALDEWKRHHAGIDYGRQRTEAQGIIRGKYFSGIKFFTREAIQDLDNKLKRTVESGQKVQVKGLNDVTVDLEIETGRQYRDESEHGDLDRYMRVHLADF